MRVSPSDAQLWKYDLLGVSVIVLTAMLAWVAVARPALARSSQEAAAAELLPAHRAQAAMAARNVAVAQTSLVTARREMSLYEQPCWTDMDRSKRVEGLSAIARAAGLTHEIVEPAEIETVAGKKATPFRMAARGKFGQTREMLAQIRKQMPDVVVRSFELRANTSPLGEVIVNAELLWVPSSGETAAPPPAAPAAENGGK